MNKAELIENISAQAKLTKADAERALNAFIHSVTHQLQAGDEVVIVGFGTFKPVERAERMGRNPRTGETMKIPASKTATFKAGKALKDAVNKG